jgi:hypothetical protein
MNASFLTDAIRDFGSAKEVARAADCSEATAARYRRGETMPDALGLARLMARSRAIADAMLRLAGLDDLTMDLEEARLVRALCELRAMRERSHGPDPTPVPPPRAAAGAMVGLALRAADRAEAGMSRALRDAADRRT